MPVKKQPVNPAKALRDCASLLHDFSETLSGQGKLTAQSLHLGANKLYRTLARDYAKAAEAAADDLERAGKR